MSIYSRIYATTARRVAAMSMSSIPKTPPPQALWAIPALTGFTWFIWGALTDDIKQSVGLYWDPDAIVDRVEAERQARIQAKLALKGGDSSASKEEEEEEDAPEEEEEDQGDAGGDDDDDDDEDALPATEPFQATKEAPPVIEVDSTDEEDEDEEEAEEEEEKPKVPKKPKKKLSDMTMEEKWAYFAENSINPGDDDDDDEDEDEDDDDDDDDDE